VTDSTCVDDGRKKAPKARAWMTTAERLWPRVGKPNSDGCREWNGGRGPQGYGVIWLHVDHKSFKALTHRVAYELSHGPIPDGLFVLHRCDNPPCCNPEHLFLGTKQDNRDDCVRKGRQAVGEINGKSKLTAAEVVQIRDLRRYGYYLTELARLYGIGATAVRQICTRTTWKHVP
jgi:HNH endonuclease